VVGLTHIRLRCFPAGTASELIEQMRPSFAGFEAHASLLRSLLYSLQGSEVRLRASAERRAMMLRSVRDAAPALDERTARHAAAAMQLYSAAAWEMLQTDRGLEGNEAAEVVALAIRTLLEGLRARSGAGSKPGDDDSNG
jgi:hypothetical protein